jgi:hypothetical protein
MEWLNIHISTLRAPEFIGSNPTERATWLCVLGYSVEQENGGRIVGGVTWKDRQWQQACGVTLREVKGAGKLLLADGADILVNGYPSAKEAHVRQARKVAHAGAMARWGSNAERHADPMPTGIANGNAEGKGREQEGKGRTGGTAVPPPSEDIFDPESMARAKAIMAADAAPKPPLPQSRSFTDFRAMHGRCFIGKDERPDWEALLRAYEWDAMHEMHEALKEDRIYLNAATAWLSKHYRITE